MARRGVLAVAAVMVLAGAGCSAVSIPGDGPVLKSRMRAVADAWDASPAVQSWRQGFFPLAPLVREPVGAWHSGADKQAYLEQNIVFPGRAAVRESGTEGAVRWAGGQRLAVPLMPAGEAYRRLAPGGGNGRPHPLRITGARLGEIDLLTSRGPAKVPAWLFTLAGYDTPLVRVAVEDSKLPVTPAQVAVDAASALVLTAISADGRVLTVSAGHGDCDGGARVEVLEAIDSVVLSGSAIPSKEDRDQVCDLVLRTEPVTVRLSHPLAGRIPLDALTGAPLPIATSAR
ncbi:hypothetical protein [Streptomyces sp. NPDC089919]|uniref:hypothetical protein n=1 Tax=Streptomyces sp. NPDC089919 TaxID=3155188 RepID=UPI0034234213